MSWHMSEKVMIGVVTSVVLASIVSIGNTVYIAKTLNTTPSLPDRVLALEIKLSAFAVTLNKMNGILDKFNTTLTDIGKTQAERTSPVSRINSHIDNPTIHGRGK